MMLRPGKLLPLLLIPVALYGLAKGLMYYKAKSTIDDMAVTLANHAELRYSGIDTDLSGAVTVRGITVQPRGYDDILSVDAIRIASDDPMMFMFGGDWTSGQEPPPDSLSFVVTGINLPLDSELVADFGTTGVGKPCESGLRVELAHLDFVHWTAPAGAGTDGASCYDPGRHALFRAPTFDRVLVVGPQSAGTTYRFAISTLSWFDLPSKRQPRPDLALLADELNALEGTELDDPVRWHAQDPNSASPELA